MNVEHYYLEIINWATRVIDDPELTAEEKVRVLGRVL